MVLDGTNGIDGTNGVDGADGQGGITNAGTGISVTGAGTSVSPYVVSTSTCGLSIGDTAQGGIIFYLDPSGCHGLVAKATDEASYYQWSSTTFNTWHMHLEFTEVLKTQKKVLLVLLITASYVLQRTFVII